MKRLDRFLVRNVVIGIAVLAAVICLSGVSLADELRHKERKDSATALQQSNPAAKTLDPSFKQMEIPADKAVVHLYRPAGSGAGGAAIPFGVKANDKVVTTLVQGGYYTYFTEPGNIEFTTFETGPMAPNSQFSVTVDVKAGQVYYIKGAHGKGLGGRANLVSVSPEVGAKEIAGCKLTTIE